jgi:hypothetical protein
MTGRTDRPHFTAGEFMRIRATLAVLALTGAALLTTAGAAAADNGPVFKELGPSPVMVGTRLLITRRA